MLKLLKPNEDWYIDILTNQLPLIFGLMVQEKYILLFLTFTYLPVGVGVVDPSL